MAEGSPATESKLRMANKLLHRVPVMQKYSPIPGWVRFVLPVLATFATGVADVLTGSELSLSVFYALPIVLAVRLCGGLAAFAIASLSTAIWAFADIWVGHTYSSSAVHGFEISIRGAFFFTVAIAGNAIASRQKVAAQRIALLEQNQRLEHQVVEISEYEQKRIGQDLHDGLCQYFAAVGCAASSLDQDLRAAGLDHFARRARELAELLSAGVGEARALARGLIPVEVGEGGLIAALHELLDSSRKLLGLQCKLERQGCAPISDTVAAVHLFRIAQEAINNAKRHGKATEILVQLSGNEYVTTLSVADNGIGFQNAQQSARGMGISIMRYRANAIGGELFLEQKRPHGTVVTCTAPVRASEEIAA